MVSPRARRFKQPGCALAASRSARAQLRELAANLRGELVPGRDVQDRAQVGDRTPRVAHPRPQVTAVAAQVIANLGAGRTVAEQTAVQLF